jgi:hypothetical protein
LAGVTVSASAAEWERVASGQHAKWIVYGDRSSVARRDGYIRAWFKIINVTPEYNSVLDKRIAYNLDQFVLNCTERTSAIASLSFYDVQDHVSGPYEYSLKFEETTPDSVREGALNWACAIAKKLK